MRRIITLFLVLAGFVSVAQNPNRCDQAMFLCANSSQSSTTVGGTANTAGIADPALAFGDGVVNHSKWFTVEGICAGASTITVSGIDNNPGLEMEIYTGSCGTLVSTGLGNAAVGPAGSMSVVIPATAVGTTYYIMVDGTGGDAEAFSVTATGCVKGRPSPSFLVSPFLGCTPLCVDLTNTSTTNDDNPITYKWTIDDGTTATVYTSSGADTTVCFNTAGNYTITLTTTNSCGTATFSQSVTAQDLVSSITPNPATTCIGMPINFTGTASVTPDPPYTDPSVTQWQWDFGDPASGAENTYTSVDGTDSTRTHIFVGAGPCFTVTLIVDGTCGPDTSTYNLCLNPKVDVNAGNDTTICEGSDATLNATVSNTTAPVTYQWTGGGAISCSGPSIACASTNVTGLTSAGSPYTFIVDILDANGCRDTDTVVVNVNPIPVVDAGPDQNICAWTPASLCANVTTGVGPFTYAWDPAAGLDDSTLKCPTANVGNTPSTTYCVTATDAAGCVSLPNCVTINVYPKPSIDITPAGPLCATDPAPLQKTFTVNGAGAGSTYTWCPSSAPNCGLITSAAADSSSIDVTFPPVPGPYCFTAIVTDGITGCVDTVNSCFTIDTGITVTVSPAAQTLCEGSCVQLTASGPAGTTWVWAPGGATTDTITVCPAAGVNLFTVVGTQGTCTGTAVATITVNPKPVVDAGPDDTVCAWIPVPLTATPTAGNGPFTYAWSPGSGLDDSTSATPVATVGATTTYCVKITDGAGCESDSDCVIVNIYPKPALSLQPDTMCASAPSLNDTLRITGANPGSTYSWCPTSDPNCAYIIQALVADSSEIVVTLPAVPGSFCYTAIVTDGVTGCKDTVSSCIQMNAGIAITVTPAATSFCEGNCTQLVATGPPGTTWSWAPGGFTTDTVNVCPVVNTVYTVTGTLGSCQGTATSAITVNPKPVVDAGPDDTVCAWTPVVLPAVVTSGSGPFIYDWSTGSGLSDSTILNPTASVGATTTYYIAITDPIGCTSDTDSITVNIYPKPSITITPPAPMCASDPQPLQKTFTVVGAGAGSTYSWCPSSDPNCPYIASAAGDSSFIVVNLPATPGPYCFTAIVTDGVTGCIDTVSSCFTLDTGITVTVSPGASSICPGNCVLLTASGPVGATWSWAPGGETTDTITVCPAATTTYTITGTFGTCTGSASSVITVNPPPTAAAASLNDSICGCDTVFLSGIGSTPGMNYLWSANPPMSFVPDSITMSPYVLNVCQNTTFTLIVTDPATGCSDTDSVSVKFNIKPNATATVNPVIFCKGDTTGVTLDGTGSSAGAGITYLWTGSPTIVSPTSLVTSDTISGSTTYTLTVTNTVTGCDSSVSVNANTYAPPTISANPSAFCTTDPLPWNTIITITSAGVGSTYTWTVPGGCVTTSTAPTDGTSETFNFDPCAVGPYTFQVIVVDGVTGCKDTLSLTINIAAGVTLTPVADTTVCFGAAYCLTSAGATSYTWYALQSPLAPAVIGNAAALCFPPAADLAVGTDTLMVIGVTGGCSDTDTVVVNVNPLPVTPPITGSSSACESSSANTYLITPSSPTSTYTWSVTGGNTFSGQGNDTILMDWAAAGTDTIFVTETDGPTGCPGAQDTLIVTINALPVSDPISGNDTVCQFSFNTYCVTNHAGSTYSWSASGGVVASGNGTNCADIEWTTAGNDTAFVIETNTVTGCSDTAQSFVVNVNPIPVIGSVTGTDTLCENTAGVSYCVAVNAGVTYIWSTTGSGMITSGQNTNCITVDWGNTSGYVIIQEVMNSTLCSDTDSVFVQVDLTPTASAGNDFTMCSGNTVQLNGSAANGNILWTSTLGSTFSSTGVAAPMYTPASAGTDTLIITVSNTCPSAADTAIVTILPAPVADAGPVLVPVCQGTAITLNGTAVSGTVTWSTASGCGSFSAPNAAVTDYIPCAGDTGTICFLMIVSNGICPDDSDTACVYFAPQPVADAGSSQIICEGDNIDLTNALASPSGITVTWSTSGSGAFSPSANVVNPTYIPSVADVAAGTVDLCLTASNAPCADSVSCMTLTISPDPIANAGPPLAPACQGTTVTLNGTASNGAVAWLTNGCGSFSSPNTAVTSYTPCVLDTGLICFLMVVSNGVCLNDSDGVCQYYAPQPAASAGVAQTICAGDSADLASASASPSNVSVIWSTTGTGSFVPSASIVNPMYVPSAADTAAGTVDLCLTASNAPCSDSVSCFTLTISPSPFVTITTTKDTICLGDITTITASGGTTYLWNTVPPQATPSISVSPSDDTTYTVLVLNSFNCPSVDSVKILVVQPPDAGPDTSICSGDTLQLNGAISPANAIGGLWTSTGNGTFVPNSTTLNASYIAGSSDTGGAVIALVLQTVTSACNDLNDTMKVSVNPDPFIYAGDDQVIGKGTTATLAPSVTNAPCILWSTSGTGTFTPDASTTTAIYIPSKEDYEKDSVTLTLSTCAGKSCIDTSDHMVLKFSVVVTPNIITPGNSPGSNDVFFIQGLPPRSKLVIFNRWGLKVFESDNYLNNWDAESCDGGVYYYVLSLPRELKLDKYEYSGFVEVVK